MCSGATECMATLMKTKVENCKTTNEPADRCVTDNY